MLGRLVKRVADPIRKRLAILLRGTLPGVSLSVGTADGVLSHESRVALGWPPSPLPLPAARHVVSVFHQLEYSETFLILQYDFT